jgi:hypothetical protein
MVEHLFNVERLLRLKIYLAILEEEGELNCNLTDNQWLIITNLKVLLQPFMIAQRLLEGVVSITKSLISYMIYKIRKGLQTAIVNDQSSQHVIITGGKMLHKLNEIFGSGEEGTVAVEHLTEGANRHPKGIPLLALMASLLDPRMKGGIGIPPYDREQIWVAIKDRIIQISIDGTNANLLIYKYSSPMFK